MNTTEYDSELPNHIVSNLVNVISGQQTNESSFLTYDYLYDSMDNNNNNNRHTNISSGGSHHLATILQHLFSKMSDNQSTYKTQTNSNLSTSSLFSSFETLLPSSPSDTNSYRLLSLISLWFVLIVNPIVIVFGVTGNLLATYILIRCNIAKLPVSFYTIMLNISDTLNLLIPVFIFWLDNCINRTPDRGYFRDRSNFLCKALMCPDQLFAALSAWYMCAISFNRWYSVCRPSSYFFRTTTSHTSGLTSGAISNHTSEINRGHKKHSSGSTIQSISVCFPFNCCLCLIHNTKFRQHLQAFRSIAFITLTGILCCLYPIFMHELRPIVVTNEHIFDLKKKTTHTYSVVWKRCYYTEKHEYAYDIIGIILSCFLHILPLTFVAAMNIMIIVRLRQRQRLMSVSTHLLQSPTPGNKKKRSSNQSQKRISYTYNSTPRIHEKIEKEERRKRHNSQPVLITTRKDQATSTDVSIQTPRPSSNQLTIPNAIATPKRHHSRDRTITIMLVSVALSYLILTLPYRLFWSYNVYIKRVDPEKLKSSIYLLKMHYIDHVLRTIRNIHYGTNFVFFIFLSKTFRRKFRQIFIEKFFQTIHRLFNRNSPIKTSNHIMNSKTARQRHSNSNSNIEQQRMTKTNHDEHCIGNEYLSRSIFDETPSLVADARMHEDEIVPIIELEHYNLSRYDKE